MIGHIIAVGCGGFVGSILRFGVNCVAARVSLLTGFPLATLTVNVIGSFLFGFFFEYFLIKEGVFPKNLDLFLFVGLLGGFTTFSSFSRDTHHLFIEGEAFVAFLNILLNFVLCIGAIFLGHLIGGAVK